MPPPPPPPSATTAPGSAFLSSPVAHRSCKTRNTKSTDVLTFPLFRSGRESRSDGSRSVSSILFGCGCSVIAWYEWIIIQCTKNVRFIIRRASSVDVVTGDEAKPVALVSLEIRWWWTEEVLTGHEQSSYRTGTLFDTDDEQHFLIALASEQIEDGCQRYVRGSTSHLKEMEFFFRVLENNHEQASLDKSITLSIELNGTAYQGTLYATAWTGSKEWIGSVVFMYLKARHLRSIFLCLSVCLLSRFVRRCLFLIHNNWNETSVFFVHNIKYIYIYIYRNTSSSFWAYKAETY